MRQKNGSRKRGAGVGEYMKSFLAEARRKQKQEAAEALTIIFPESTDCRIASKSIRQAID
jgi:hypothetical protein